MKTAKDLVTSVTVAVVTVGIAGLLGFVLATSIAPSII